MRVVGVDLGTRRIAAACPEVSFVWSTTLKSAYEKRTWPTEFEAGLELGMRLNAALHDGDVFGDTPLLFVAERPLVHHQRPNMRSAVGMALSAGAAMSRMSGQVVLLDSPSQWKKELCGDGSADKEAIARWITSREPALAALCGEVEDRYDAVGIALAAANMASDGRL